METQDSIKNLTTSLQKPCIPDVETEMSRRYLAIMERWIPTGIEYFQEWPSRPNCGHFFGGAYWYGLETAVPLEVLALAISSPEYDEKLVGFSKEELIETAVKAIRYLCFTHDTGPEDCVRPKTGLGRPELCGTKWGERGRGFFPESQCGNTIANITISALILRRWLDGETWGMVANICADYLNRFGSMPPMSGVYADTQMEENGWTSLGLASSLLFLERHERARELEENAKRWMFCTATVPQDMFNHKKFEDGLTVSRLCRRVFTALPDFMAENHGFIHPSYVASSIVYTGLVGNVYRIYGRREPRHLYWHRQELYENLKRLCDSTGSPHPIQGMDWPYLWPNCFLHTSAYLYLGDSDAGYYERVALNLLEKIQLGFNGRMVNPEAASRCHDVQDPLIMRELHIGVVAASYLAHRLFAWEKRVEPTGWEEIYRKFMGVKVYPHSGFIFHKHRRGQTSFSWRNHVMALPLTSEGLLTLGPSNPIRGPPALLGRISVKDYERSQEILSINVREEVDGFAAALVEVLHQGSVRRHVFFVSLPDGRVVSVEKFTALKECTVEMVEQGYLEITNENFPYVEGNCKGFRRLYHPEGVEAFRGFAGTAPDEDILFTIKSPEWLNLDDRVGMVFKGSGRTVYRNRHYFRPPSSPYHALADDLILSVQDEPRRYRAGEDIAKLILVLHPEQRHEETERMRFTEAVSDGEVYGLLVDEYLCVCNFNKDGCQTLKMPRRDVISIFPGVTTVGGREVSYTVSLRAKSGAFYKAAMFIETEGENLRVEHTPCGFVHFTNKGSETLQLGYKREGEARRLRIRAGETVTVAV